MTTAKPYLDMFWIYVACSLLGSTYSATTPSCTTPEESGVCYWRVNAASTWKAALKDCQDSGGTLAMVKTDSTERFLVTHFLISSGTLSWVGGASGLVKTAWRWADSEVFTREKWHSSQPDGPKSSEDQFCLLYDGLTWHDRDCSETHGYVCQSPPGSSCSDTAKCITNVAWTVTEDQCLLGHDYEVYTSVSLVTCKQLCAHRIEAKCKSFKFDAVSGECHVSKTNEAENGLLTSCPGYQHHDRIEPTPAVDHSRYQRVDAGGGWAAAKDHCESLDKILVTISSQAENDLVKNYFMMGSDGWIGLDDSAVFSVYRWADGSYLSWANWQNTKPTTKLESNNNRYVRMNSDGTWEPKALSDHSNRFVCETAPAPTTTQSTPITTTTETLTSTLDSGHTSIATPGPDTTIQSTPATTSTDIPTTVVTEGAGITTAILMESPTVTETRRPSTDGSVDQTTTPQLITKPLGDTTIEVTTESGGEVGYIETTYSTRSDDIFTLPAILSTAHIVEHHPAFGELRWDVFTPWTGCSKQCDIIERRYRIKLCSEYNGTDCALWLKTWDGDLIYYHVDVGDCEVTHCPVDGAWNHWGNWSECGATCGSGLVRRRRTCKQPQDGGQNCRGSSNQVMECSAGIACPALSRVDDGPVFKEADYRQSAQGIGSVEVLLVLVVVLAILIGDINKCRRDARRGCGIVGRRVRVSTRRQHPPQAQCQSSTSNLVHAQ